MHSSRYFCVLLFAMVASTGCTVVRPYRIVGMPTQHVVMVDANGRLMDPTGSVFCHPENVQADNAAFVAKKPKKKVAPPPSYSWKPCNGRFNSLSLRELNRRDGIDLEDNAKLYLDDIFTHMNAYYAERTPKGQRQKRKLVFIIHGGLNTNQTTLHRAQDLSQGLLDDGYYPIFINWQSNLWRALWRHLVKVRQGDDFGYSLSFLAPFYLIGDLGKGISRAPVLWFYSITNDVQGLMRMAKRYYVENPRDDASVAYNRLRDARRGCSNQAKNKTGNEGTAEATPCSAIDIQRGDFKVTWPEGSLANARAIPTGAIPLRVLLNATGRAAAGPWTLLPAKYFVTPLLDGLGSSAWENMRRSAVLGFHTDGSSSEVFGNDPNDTGDGGLSRFFTRLQQEVEAPSSCTSGQKPGCVEWEMTMVAHSMGAIVANQVLQHFNGLNFRRIVYMAAASSVREYEDAVLNYMKSHPKTHMYHLLLDDVAELRDQYFYQLPPSGSLLVWVDRFFTRPATLRDRTVGRYDNLIRFVDDTPPALKSRVHVRVFGVGKKLANTEPQSHGAFGAFIGLEPRPGKFWDPQFWRTDMTGLDDTDPVPTEN